jgi:thioredoxin-dependent peroxiredoxin
MPPSTMDNLKMAFAGESQANRKYIAYARKAKEEGLLNVATLFNAAAGAETIHALGHFKAMDGIHSTADNIKDAIGGETYEFTQMYPPMIALAEEDRHRAKVMFNYAAKAEQVHAVLYQRALDSVSRGQDLPRGDFYLCPYCGNIESGKPSVKCSICGAAPEKFSRVGLPRDAGAETKGAQITLRGNKIQTVGKLPAVGAAAPDFCLTRGDLSDVSLEAFSGRKKLLSISPSLDTGVCAASARRFNQEAAQLPNVVVLLVTADLPFAQQRFCEAEGLKSVVPLSELRSCSFGYDYGVSIADGPMAGLLSRAIVVLDENNRVVYTEQVPEIAQEPNYGAALAALK